MERGLEKTKKMERWRIEYDVCRCLQLGDTARRIRKKKKKKKGSGNGNVQLPGFGFNDALNHIF